MSLKSEQTSLYKPIFPYNNDTRIIYVQKWSFCNKSSLPSLNRQDTPSSTLIMPTYIPQECFLCTCWLVDSVDCQRSDCWVIPLTANINIKIGQIIDMYWAFPSELALLWSLNRSSFKKLEGVEVPFIYTYWKKNARWWYMITW